MPRHISILFPGQGSQSLGMLNHHSTDLLKSYEEEINNLLGFNIIDVINNGPIEDLNKTSITQPAILLASILDFKNISNKLGLIPDILCGHSLGEYSAMVAANAISLQEGLSLVHKRGKLMEKCPNGSMCAVLNVDLDVINEICSKVEDEIKTIVTPANLNSPKQIVVSGTEEGVDEVINRLKDCGYKKCIKLKVSVAAHSKVMSNTLNQFENELNKINFSLPEYSIIQNVNNKIPNNIDNLKENLLSQLVMPVQWINTMKQIKKYDGIVIECGPKKVLSVLAKANGIENVYSTSSEDFFDKIKEEL
jgi:[acyl-carrier-protein] S-malonyltransferase